MPKQNGHRRDSFPFPSLFPLKFYWLVLRRRPSFFRGVRENGFGNFFCECFKDRFRFKVKYTLKPPKMGSSFQGLLKTSIWLHEIDWRSAEIIKSLISRNYYLPPSVSE